MAIDTTDKKYAVMDWEAYDEPGIVLVEASPFSQANKQQLLWGYPGVLWSGSIPSVESSWIPRLLHRRRR